LLRPFGHSEAERLTRVRRDQAPAQGAQRVEGPAPVGLLGLPASSPALPPGERRGEDLKRRSDVLAPRVRSRLTALQSHGAELLQRYTGEMSASLTGYAYLVEAAKAI